MGPVVRHPEALTVQSLEKKMCTPVMESLKKMVFRPRWHVRVPAPTSHDLVSDSIHMIAVTSSTRDALI